MMWIKLFNFSIKYVLKRKHSAADNFLQKSENSLLNKEVDTVNDFIDLQLNSIHEEIKKICSFKKWLFWKVNQNSSLFYQFAAITEFNNKKVLKV